ncbi:MAG: hypothetical protein IPJ71_17515 [Bdellovibrionales bacterium]|nr:hypothetical protein [Bdellovibrionales bacterium]
MRLFLVLMSFGISFPSFSQSVDLDAQSKGFAGLRQSGELVSLELVPKGKQLRLKLVGNEAASVKMGEVSVEATYGFGKVKKRLTVTKQQGEFLITRDKVEPVDLNIRVMTPDQVEDFDFQLK